MFSPVDFQTFQLFSPSHIAVIVLFLIICIFFLLYLKKAKLTNNKRLSSILVTIFIVSELSYQIWALSVRIWESKYFLPLQLCSFSTFFGLYLHFKRSTVIFYFFFYIGFLPPILAILTPDLLYDFPHYFFGKFFIQHMAIPISAVYLLVAKDYNLPFKSVWISFLCLNLVAIPIGGVNYLLGSNYFFLSGPPVSDTALSLFGNGWFYILQLEILALFFFHLTFVFGKGILLFTKKN
ncbi:TIGR02206 family membrane protein [Jeotgalibacillus soli]|nr:TIGR02206 family membrane protein [Jeotgalibacillus soli]